MNRYLQLLKELIKRDCLQVKPEGEFFTLKSGKKSSYYLDLRKLTLSSLGVSCVACLFESLIMRSNLEYDAIGGPSIGADPIVGAILGRRVTRKTNGFLVRPQPKSHGLDGRLIGPVKKGDKCLLVEDTVTSGSSVLDCAYVLREFGCTVSNCLCIVDRLEGAKELLRESGINLHSLLTVKDLGIHN